VEQTGNPVNYVISLGYNIQTQQGEEAVDFHGALYSLCMELCLRNVGWQQYQPFPLLNDPPPPMPDDAQGDMELQPQAAVIQQPEPQAEAQPALQPEPQPEPEPMPHPELPAEGAPAEAIPAPQPAPLFQPICLAQTWELWLLSQSLPSILC
jgi:hypothetical protein